jgi:DAACS family dicarboxylate/amino acid:cation (Na+ or H+) symporter
MQLSVPHRSILIALVGGALMGVVANASFVDPGPPAVPPAWLAWLLRNVTEPVGRVFLNLLIMTVVPLVFASLAVGVARLGHLNKLGRLGAKTAALFLVTSTSAAVLGLVLVNLISPGKMISDETVTQLRQAYGQSANQKAVPAEFGVQTFVNMVPRNPIQAAAEMNMLGVIVFALLVGVGLTRITPERAAALVPVLDAIGELMIFIISVAMRLAPVGIFCLIFSTTAQFGFGLLVSLGLYVLVVLIGLGVQLFGVFSLLLKLGARLNPWQFFRSIRGVMLTAFSTSSSNATLPTSLRTAQEDLGVPKPIAGFVLPLGATMNMNGTALFEGVTVLFLAQVAGLELSLGQQALVVILSVLTAIGAAGVPGGSIPLIAMVLVAVNVPPELLFLILGIDRILDMMRTTVNVVGDLTVVMVVHRLEPAPATATTTETPTAANEAVNGFAASAEAEQMVDSEQSVKPQRLTNQ